MHVHFNKIPGFSWLSKDILLQTMFQGKFPAFFLMPIVPVGANFQMIIHNYFCVIICHTISSDNSLFLKIWCLPSPFFFWVRKKQRSCQYNAVNYAASKSFTVYTYVPSPGNYDQRKAHFSEAKFKPRKSLFHFSFTICTMSGLEIKKIVRSPWRNIVARCKF